MFFIWLHIGILILFQTTLPTTGVKGINHHKCLVSLLLHYLCILCLNLHNCLLSFYFVFCFKSSICLFVGWKSIICHTKRKVVQWWSNLYICLLIQHCLVFNPIMLIIFHKVNLFSVGHIACNINGSKLVSYNGGVYSSSVGWGFSHDNF